MVRARWFRGVCIAAGMLFAAPIAVGQGAAVVPTDVSVQYQLLTAFAGSEKAGGQIVVTLRNQSSHALSKVTLRLADPSVGRITGPVQEEIDLKAGETRKLQGEFLLNVEKMRTAPTLDWIVVYANPDGFAEQWVVRGEALAPPAMDGAAATARH
jgi:hypothetical protein